jgi:hypothetical protein
VRVVPLSPRSSRRVGLVRLRGKRSTEGVKAVTAALLTLRPSQSARRTGIAARTAK